MSINQSTYCNQKFTKFRRRRFRFYNARMLRHSPTKRGIVRQVRILTPRKPNSARRTVFKLWLSNRLHTVSSIKGPSHSLKRYSTVLICGTGARDLPGVYSHCIRGCYDLHGLIWKRRRRSIYGLPRYLMNRRYYR